MVLFKEMETDCPAQGSFPPGCRFGCWTLLCRRPALSLPALHVLALCIARNRAIQAPLLAPVLHFSW